MNEQGGDSGTIRHFMDADPSTAPQASYTPDIAGALDTELDEVREIAALPDAKATFELSAWMDRKRCTVSGLQHASEMFRLMLIHVMEARHPKREAWIWAIAAGMECTMGINMKRLAKTLRMTKQAISKSVNDRIDRYGLSRNANLQSDESRRHFRAAQLARHGTAHKMSASCNGRKPTMLSVESVLLRFMAWSKAHQATTELVLWPTERLEAIYITLYPIHQCWQSTRDELLRRQGCK